MFIAVRRASAMVDTIGLTPEQLGIPLALRPLPSASAAAMR
jgi:hypothetical protein